MFPLACKCYFPQEGNILIECVDSLTGFYSVCDFYWQPREWQHRSLVAQSLEEKFKFAVFSFPISPILQPPGPRGLGPKHRP